MALGPDTSSPTKCLMKSLNHPRLPLQSIQKNSRQNYLLN